MTQLKNDFEQNTNIIKTALKQSNVNIKYNSVVDKIKEIETKLSNTPDTERTTYMRDVLQIRTPMKVMRQNPNQKKYITK